MAHGTAPGPGQVAGPATQGAPGDGPAPPRRGLVPVAVALAVLVLVGGYALVAGVQAVSTMDTLQQTLRDDRLIGTAHTMIAQEGLELQRYRAMPTADTRRRFVAAADAVANALLDAQESMSQPARADAMRLAAEQAEYRKQVDPTVAAAASPTAAEVLGAQAAFQTLAQDADGVRGRYGSAAERQTDALRGAMLWLLTATLLGVGVGAVGAAAAVLGRRRAGAAAPPGAPEPDPAMDPLTELPDEARLVELVTAALDEAQLTGGRGVTILAIGLDGYEATMRAFGRDGCDQLLVAASRRLRRVVRDIDLVTRFGEADFGVLLRDMNNRADVQAVTDRVEQALGRDFRLQGGITSIRPCIGIAFGAPGDVPLRVIQAAGTALIRVRAAGGGVAFADPGAGAVPTLAGGPVGDAWSVAGGGWGGAAPVDLAGDLRAVLNAGDQQGQLLVEYQPVVRLADAAVTDVEAAVTWQHPRHGDVDTDELLTLAVANGLAVPLLGHVILLAAAQAAAWHFEGGQLAVTVNIAKACLTDPWFVPSVRVALERTGLPPYLLRLAIDEADAMVDLEPTANALDDLRRLGVGICIDGYGVASSSLTRLKQLPIDEVKLDRGLVRELRSRGEDQALVRGTIEMAHTLGLRIVADGVTDIAALRLLHDYGCDRVQGAALSGPVPPNEIVAAGALAHQAVWTVAEPAGPDAGSPAPGGTAP